MSILDITIVFLCIFGAMLSIMLAWKEVANGGKHSMKYAVVQLLFASFQATYLIDTLIK